MRRNPNLVERVSDAGVYLFERQAGGYRSFDGRVLWPIGAFFEAERLRPGTGRSMPEEAASGATIVRGVPAHGYVVYGPYRSFPPGRYVARYRTRGVGTIDVAADHGHAILGERGVSGKEWGDTTLAFELERARTLEFRAAAGSTGALDIDWILVTTDEPSASGKLRIEAEELTATAGLDREAPDASAGAFAELGDPPGEVARDGPYRFVAAGRLELGVRARGGPFVVRLERPDGRRRFAEIEIAARSDWTDTRATVDVTEEGVIVTRLVSLGPAANVDYIELERR